MHTAPYEEVECPNCYGGLIDCHLCDGTNLVDPVEANNFLQEQRESFFEDTEEL